MRGMTRKFLKFICVHLRKSVSSVDIFFYYPQIAQINADYYSKKYAASKVGKLKPDPLPALFFSFT